MGTGGPLGAAGAVLVALVALVALGAPPAHGEELSGIFQLVFKAECHYLNGTERVRFLEKYIYNREQDLYFDSDVGHYVGNTPEGEFQAKHFNSQVEILEQTRAAVDTFCRHNYGVWSPLTVDRRVPPKVEIFPVQSSSAPQTNRLACAVSDFYPAPIEVRWFQNGREELQRVVSTDVIQNGDWTYQVLVMLETTPQRGDTYACQVEHVSLQQPSVVHWELTDGSNSKMVTGIGGFMLGLIFIVVGLIFYMRKKGTYFPPLQASS
ncbi:class II histocompatibility antigen, B-L beta chain-like [Neopsephotus bourkii]|uniref:class II histocompatibility antigen, B-L beta chain-like n=1 Tax=Neopsephotus bourkii TaxID=309878 RepID=UPI002AA4F870|nr:class II histocompatibility antigen, B-L beta chain-like [Neopsephotus bourkii]XP_061224826.1 class II histocompatibility antigen, B-L beta chain-like [Neopsephotus bourkii]